MSDPRNDVDDSDDDDETSGRRSRWRNVGVVLCVLLVPAAVWPLRAFLAHAPSKGNGVHQIALINQPPPPPPKPPEKPPEPPKIKEEVKIDQPKAEPKPEEPKAADEKPASDKPLALDATGGAGNDGFGLAGSKGGRDLLATGSGGGGGAYYSGLLQRQFFDALSRNRKILHDEFRVVVKIWLSDDGHVTKADIVTGSGDAQVDEQIQVTLMDMAPLRDVPPPAMRPIELRLSNRS